MKMRTFIPIAALTVAALQLPVESAAQTTDSVVTAKQPEIRTARVSYRDLNLTSATAVTLLRKRVRNVAGQLCTDDGAAYAYFPSADMRCVRGAVRGAEPQIARAVERASDPRVASLQPMHIKIAMIR